MIRITEDPIAHLKQKKETNQTLEIQKIAIKQGNKNNQT